MARRGWWLVVVLKDLDTNAVDERKFGPFTSHEAALKARDSWPQVTALLDSPPGHSAWSYFVEDRP